jgi:hypothetical protein
MSLLNTIAHGVEGAASAVAGAAQTAAGAVGGTVVKVYDAVGDAVESAALATADGANLFAAGWRDVFGGSFKDGLAEIGVGLGETVGVVPPSVASRYEQAVGAASLWALRQAHQASDKTCYGTYRTQVQAEIARLGLTWNAGMDDPLRSGAAQMPWIDLGC